MSNHLLCEEPVIIPCPETFRLQASKWIDSSNFGTTKLPSPPPAGIRLRWNCPFLSADPAQRQGQPKKYSVWRSDPLENNTLTDYQPTVGHKPRNRTPTSLWSPLAKINELLYTINSDARCETVEAVYFEIPNNVSSVTVTLIDLDGRAKVTGKLNGGDIFYFELGGITQVVFSADPQLQQILGLSLTRHYALGDIHFHEIASVDAECWTNLTLAELAVRLANASGKPFISITEEQWEELIVVGKRISDGYQTGNTVEQNDIDALQLASGLYWEVAALIGLGYIDGEHPSLQNLDMINNTLNHADEKNYAYYVTALLDKEGVMTEIKSSLYFTEAFLMKELGEISAQSVDIPVSRSELTNPFIEYEGEIIPDGQAVEQFYCTTEWELHTALPDTEIVITIPMASDSQITGEPFIPVGMFYSGSNENLIEFSGLHCVIRRKHRYRIPYFDSDVWLGMISADSWGRRRELEPSTPIQPAIEYKGQCLPISEGRCDPQSKKMEIKFDQTLKWVADAIARNSRGKIDVLIKDPVRQALSVLCHIGPAFPTTDGNWAGEITDALIEQNQLSRLINGTLVVNGFTAHIISLVQIDPRRLKCVFGATTECAGAVLYPTHSGVADAYMNEDPYAPGLWHVADSIDLLADGSPTVYNIEMELTNIEKHIPYVFDHSITLYFATRLAFSFEDNPFLGSVSVPLAVPYLHPVPKTPEVCFDVQQVAVDYYGRTIVHVTSGKCPTFDPRYKCRMKVAMGSVSDPEVFADTSAEGLLGTQYATVNRSLWEVFPTLNRFPESSTFTVGISYFREADNGEGLSQLDRFEARRIEE